MSFKKIFLALSSIISSFVLMASLTKVGALAAPSTPWTLSFDNGQVLDVNASTDFASVVANSFSITFNDTTGKSQIGSFDIFESCKGLEQVRPVIYKQTIQNGQTFTYNFGGELYLRAYHYEYGQAIYDADFYNFFIDRSIVNSNRINTNLQQGIYFYKESIGFSDGDFNKEPDLDLTFKIMNVTTGKYIEYDPYQSIFYLHQSGKYEVTAIDNRKHQSKVYTFAIDKTAPIIQLYEWNWMIETPKLSGDITSYGMKVVYGDNIQVNSMTYEYRPTKGRIEFGTMPNEQIFWRKGDYTITVIDMVGNKTVSTFTITDYDLIVDPVGATVGTEVTKNKGAYLDTTMHVGYTRCIYLGANANSQSRFNFNFTSSDESIATISAYGTVTAHGAGTVIITSVSKVNGQIGKIILIVLPK